MVSGSGGKVDFALMGTSIKNKSGRLKFRVVFPLVVGVLMGVFLLLFSMVNSEWIAIRIPSMPWHSEPSWVAFESQLWLIMLVCFSSGVAVLGILYMVSAIKWRRRFSRQLSRIRELEQETQKADRLIAATRELE
jgi:vacuolar-type H+-ATPase subunit I/STV1